MHLFVCRQSAVSGTAVSPAAASPPHTKTTKSSQDAQQRDEMPPGLYDDGGDDDSAGGSGWGHSHIAERMATERAAGAARSFSPEH